MSWSPPESKTFAALDRLTFQDMNAYVLNNSKYLYDEITAINTARVNADNLTSGTLGWERFPAGSPLNVVAVTKSASQSLSVAKDAISSDVSDFAPQITPKSNSSKILVQGSINLGHSDDGTRILFVYLYRNGSKIAEGPSDGTKKRAMAVEHCDKNASVQVPFSFLDSPNSTSAQTYTIRLGHNDGSTKNVKVNNGSSGGTAVSTITLTEIKG